ncbi:MAG: FAD:protein FMN transferase [Pseudomonadota bacterium]|nr:FAD:protein FMN transferase [Pseudomonadota bacterium]
MTGRAFHAMGTEWWVAADRDDLLPAAEALVHGLEDHLTRFTPSSALCRLNSQRRSEDPLLREILAEALRLGDRTGGAFDPTLGRDLVGLGYDRTFTELGVASPYFPDLQRRDGQRQVHLTPTGVVLDGPFDVDLGGIGKGWTVDRVHDWLRSAGARRVLVDGGGDLRGSGQAWPIGVESGGAVSLVDGAIATSSTRMRRWRAADGVERHHLLDPRTREPATSRVEVATVRAATATLADVLATALIVDPDGVLPLLGGLGADALLGDAARRWWVTSNWKEAA